MRAPRLKAPDDVAGPVEAELNQVAGGEDRRVAVIAHEDQPLVEAGEVLVTPWTVEGDPPLEDGPRNMEASRDDSTELAGVLGTDIDDEPVVRTRREGLGGREPGDVLGGFIDEGVQRTARGAATIRPAV